MGKTVTDLFSNIAYASVTESAANTLTFSEIQTGISVHEKVAWVISRIVWHIPTSTLILMAAAADGVNMGLVLSNKIDDLEDMADPSLVDNLIVSRHDFGTGASGYHLFEPIVKDYSALPGKGLIVTPKPLYAACQGISLSTPATVSCRIFYTTKELAADEFWELVQASRIVQ